LEYNVVGEAENGFKGVELYKELRPDIVFMDISMPEMDGVEALQRIREIDPQAVVIICSAVSQQDLIADAMKRGANGYVMKPFKPKQIKEAVEKYAPLVVRTEQISAPEPALDPHMDELPGPEPEAVASTEIEFAAAEEAALEVAIVEDVHPEINIELEQESAPVWSMEPETVT